MENALDKLFNESRWSKYYYGEIHVVTADLIPNSRRDYFLESIELENFENLVRTKFYELERLNYFSSNLRSNQKKIDDLAEFTKAYKEKSTKVGFTNEEERKTYEEKFENIKEKAKNAEKEIAKVKDKVNLAENSQKKIFDKVVGNKKTEIVDLPKVNEKVKTKFITDDLTTLSRKDRKLISRIFGVVDNVLPKDIAGILKEKIKEELQ